MQPSNAASHQLKPASSFKVLAILILIAGMHGANAWFAYNFTHSFAVVAEVSSQRASDIGGSGQDLTLTSYLFGPRYSWHKSGHFAPFAQVLLGGAHGSVKRVASGVGEGSVAVQFIHQYLSKV